MITIHVNTEEFRRALQSVKPHIPSGEDWADLAGARLTFTDVTGLWPGKVYEIPAAPHSRPLAMLPKIFREALHSKPKTPGDLDLSGQLLKFFASIASAYEGRLTMQPTRKDRILLVTIGEQFVGLLMPRRIDPDSEDAKALETVRSTWTDTLTGM